MATVEVSANVTTARVELFIEYWGTAVYAPQQALDLARQLMRAAFALGAEGTPKEPEAEGGE